LKGRRPRPLDEGGQNRISSGYSQHGSVGSHVSLGHDGPNPQTNSARATKYSVRRAPIAQLVELRTFNWWIWAFAALASVGAFGIYMLLAALIGLVALAEVGWVWKRCGINCGIDWSAHSICSRGSIALGSPPHARSDG
jgi:hypothetical protein